MMNHREREVNNDDEEERMISEEVKSISLENDSTRGLRTMDAKAALVERLFCGEEDYPMINILTAETFYEGLNHLLRISYSGHVISQVFYLLREGMLRQEGENMMVENFPALLEYLKANRTFVLNDG